LPPFAPSPGGLSRLTVVEYHNTLRDLFGSALALKTVIEADAAATYSSIGAATAVTSERGLELYEAAAREVGEIVFSDSTRREALVGCAPTDVKDSCVRDFLRRFGRRVWRRPLSDAEIDALAGVAQSSAQAYGSVWSGVQWAVVTLLASPYFVHRVELGLDDAKSGRRRYSGYEIASRMSYFLWASMPDDALLDAAERGELDSADGVRAQARRMVESPKAREAALRFFAEDLHLDALIDMSKDPVRYPAFSKTIGAAMREEIRRVIADNIFDRRADFTELLDTRTTFVNGELAALYGIALPAGQSGDTFVQATLPAAGGRAGLLGLAGFLALKARVTKTSPTIRGKFIRERLLCTKVPDPPANVDAQLPEVDPNAPPQTMRQRLERHRTDPACSGCHSLTDPLGLSFEHFDGIGKYRPDDQGMPLDVRGSLDGIAYEDAGELAALLRTDRRVPGCVVKHLYSFAVGHEVQSGELRVVADLTKRFVDGGKRWIDLLVDVVASDGFRLLEGLK
ncbi:MAG: DUF1592 domain-containing protein, partial [Myxococcales bacterium]|nr:DUF1592 domain-containing protein [Myxococcales bacterium]